MRVTALSISHTKQLRPYEPERIELTIEVQEGDSTQEAIARARATIKEAFGEKPDQTRVSALKAELAEAEAKGF